MCQCNDCINPRIVIEDKKIDTTTVNVVGISPINIAKQAGLGQTTFKVSVDLPESTNGHDGKDGINGKDGISPTITINQVISGSTAQVTNVGTSTDVRLNFVIPKGQDGLNGSNGENGANGKDGNNGKDGKDGVDGITNGIKAYLISDGNNSGGDYVQMGNFSQGTYVDTGDSTSKKLRIKAWVTVSSMRNWTTLRLTTSDFPSYNGSILKQIVKHSEGELYVGEWEINHITTTSSRYIGFTFADNTGGTYSSDGEFYGSYAIEVFILN